ncbi:hypothetical protein TRFO_01744 [Tritrichomonas foetus]|uniref:Protein kinase domain-containing protein n=1 Tax=Tritrichomonas foetus TaxID=1144522 RepID=A0A1J4JV55_9EUKA|nr:hypothetical protein TRFO_01744 [Tritrichomonas foetus]|eukprot:OHT01141.1 hypothetical protein TRFO_01744 [Tritrichomonas foetus]
MTCRNPDLRISIDEIISHPFMAKVYKVTDYSYQPGNLNDISNQHLQPLLLNLHHEMEDEITSQCEIKSLFEINNAYMPKSDLEISKLQLQSPFCQRRSFDLKRKSINKSQTTPNFVYLKGIIVRNTTTANLYFYIISLNSQTKLRFYSRFYMNKSNSFCLTNHQQPKP